MTSRLITRVECDHQDCAVHRDVRAVAPGSAREALLRYGWSCEDIGGSYRDYCGACTELRRQAEEEEE